jgi:hypothetical protein
MAKQKKHSNNENPELSKAMHGLNSSSAASPHEDRRTRRARTRLARKNRALKDET